jgi:hypothetical protein
MARHSQDGITCINGRSLQERSVRSMQQVADFSYDVYLILIYISVYFRATMGATFGFVHLNIAQRNEKYNLSSFICFETHGVQMRCCRIYNDCDYIRDILCSAIFMFRARKQNPGGHKFIQEWEVETVITRLLLTQNTLS